MRYRLDVIAPNVLDVVDSVGGWLFDRAIGGWDVNVMVDDHDDPRPLPSHRPTRRVEQQPPHCREILGDAA